MPGEPWRAVLEWPSAVCAGTRRIRRAVAGARLVALGEEHAKPWIIRSAALLLRWMARHTPPDRLALAMEMFNTEQQGLLDEWLRGERDWRGLLEEYRRGSEGFPLEVYRSLMEEARSLGARIVGVMPPRTAASRVARTGELPDLPRDAPSADPRAWRGYADSLRPLFPRAGPMARIPLERLLLAQSYKDSVAAHTVAQLLVEGYTVLLLMGWAHVEAPGSVPDRALHALGLGWEWALIIGAREAGVEEYRARGEHGALGLRSRFTLLGP